MWVVTNILSMNWKNYENMHGLNKKRFPLFTTHQLLLFTTNVVCVNGLGHTLHVNVNVRVKYIYDFTLLCETM